MRTLMAMGAALVVGLASSGCVSVATHSMVTAYDPAAQAIGAGNNSISGNALLRTVGGEARTCAGIPISLYKATPYTIERVRTEFGTTESSFRAMGDNIVNFEPENPAYLAAGRTTTCDSQGNFEFNDLADGDYYIETYLTWRVPSQFGQIPTGGTLMAKVSLANGERERVVMAY